MTVRQLIEMLQTIEDKDKYVYYHNDVGIITGYEQIDYVVYLTSGDD